MSNLKYKITSTEYKIRGFISYELFKLSDKLRATGNKVIDRYGDI